MQQIFKTKKSVIAIAMVFSVTMIGLAACGGSDGDTPAVIDPEVAIDQRAADLVAQLTLDEKIQLVHGQSGGLGVGLVKGVPRLGIPDYNTVDSSVGVNAMYDAKTYTIPTTMPSTLGLAASWDPDLSYEYGAIIAKEARTLGYAEALGGGVNLAREPRNGRTFEYLGEDPVLAGEMITPRIKGTQDNKVVATIKHYIANDQETNRRIANAVIDERTMREMHMLPFEIGIKDGQPGNVMCAYNLVNGLKACENKYLLTDVLKGEWGFKGKVQSDWTQAVTNTVRGAMAGTDEEQPGSTDDEKNGTFYNQRLKAAVLAGTVPVSRLDDMVKRRLRTMIKVGVMDNPPPTTRGTVDVVAGDAFARKAAEQSMVLLKNAVPSNATSPVLPLSSSMTGSIVVIGGNADAGVMIGGGSGGAYPRGGNAVKTCVGIKVSTPIPINNNDLCALWNNSAPLAAVKAKAPNATVTYYDGKDSVAAANAAANADVAIVFATQWQREVYDLETLSLPDDITDPRNQSYDQNALITAVAAKAKKMVVVLETGTAVLMPWIDSVHSVLEAWYPGGKGGEAIANVLFGSVNPSGKLPLTFPKKDADLPATIASKDGKVLALPKKGETPPSTATETVEANGIVNVPYTEGRKIGYRWYDSQNITPLFPFGHGLSYTTFAYSGATTSVDASGNLTVNFTLKNTGKVAGAEVAQIYAAVPGETGEPPKRLIGWKKVQLAAGESKSVSMTVKAQRLAIWDTTVHQWRVPSGAYVFYVGASSRDANALTNQQTIKGGLL